MQVSLRVAKRLLKKFIAKKKAVMLTGAPGLGKSQLIHQLAQELGWGLVDIRAARLDPVDTHGVPVPDMEKMKTVWLIPDMLPQVERDGEFGILFLDELSDAAKAIQSALYGLILEGRLGSYVLPKGWVIVAAGNRREDRAAAQQMSTALKNRFAHLEIVVDHESWVEYANQRGLAPVGVAFVRFRPNLLHQMPKDDREMAFPTPRSIEAALDFADEPAEERQMLIAATVGQTWAGEFEGFARIWEQLPNPDECVKNPRTAPVPQDSEASVFFALSTAIARRATKDNFAAVLQYAGRMPKEFEIITCTDAVRRDPELVRTRAYSDWAARNQEVLL